MAQTLSVYLLAFAASTLIWGPLSDALGRRRVAVTAMALYVAASLGCAMTDSLSQMLLLRFAQGIAASGGIVIARAVVRDVYDGHQARKAMAQVVMMFALAPAAAPIIGPPNTICDASSVSPPQNSSTSRSRVPTGTSRLDGFRTPGPVTVTTRSINGLPVSNSSASASVPPSSYRSTTTSPSVRSCSSRKYSPFPGAGLALPATSGWPSASTRTTSGAQPPGLERHWLKPQVDCRFRMICGCAALFYP